MDFGECQPACSLPCPPDAVADRSAGRGAVHGHLHVEGWPLGFAGHGPKTRSLKAVQKRLSSLTQSPKLPTPVQFPALDVGFFLD